MILFYIHFEDDEGNNYDLFVWANSRSEARDIWRDYYDFDTNVPLPILFEVPHTPPAEAGAISWDDL